MTPAEKTREAAVDACKQVGRDFLSPEYATGQPISSFAERFACAQCAAAIHALHLPADPVRDAIVEALRDAIPILEQLDTPHHLDREFPALAKARAALALAGEAP